MQEKIYFKKRIISQIKKFICVFVFIFFILVGNIGIIAVEESKDSDFLYVGGIGQGNYSSISSALFAAENADVIIVYPGFYEESLSIEKAVSIIGIETDTTIIRGDGLNNVINVNNDNVHLENLSIIHSGSYEYNYINNIGKKTSIKKNYNSIESVDLNFVNINFSGIYSIFDDLSVKSCVFSDCDSGVVLRNTTKTLINSCSFLGNDNGILLINSTSSSIENCVFLKNNEGIFNLNSEFINLSFCNFSSNSDFGIFYSESDNSNVHHSFFYNNSLGILLTNNSQNNIFYQNNFIGNKQKHAQDDNTNNLWDNGIRGNYWDDFEEKDANSDGIFDSPYKIPDNSRDNFPYVNSIIFDKFLGKSIIIREPSIVQNSDDNFSISCEVSGSSNISSVLLKCDNSKWTNMDNTTEYSWFSIKKNDDEIQTIFVSALDEEGYAYARLFELNDDQEDFITNENENSQGKEDDSSKLDENETPSFEFFLISLVFLFLAIYFKKKKRRYER